MTATVADERVAALIGSLTPRCDVRGCVPLPAVAIAWFRDKCCDEAEAADLLCACHRGVVAELVAAGSAWRCLWCAAVRYIDRIEPL